ncbi:hypothetical protein [Longirhabdus pacifica]|uniref:hypothetical protein n=1 Tax=Longirhabdus pacifica TaxID=2305227 RepID=UPI0010091825|nr:hypothetical protein [Longirhabdus pacifica]
MKKGLIFGFILMLSIVLTACGGSDEVSVQDDLISFVNEAAKIDKEHVESSAKLENLMEPVLATGVFDITEEEYDDLVKTLEEMISSLDNLSEPETEEVKSLYNQHVDSSKKIFTATLGIFEAMKNGDMVKVTEETVVMTEATSELLDTTLKLNTLAAEHDVILELDELGVITKASKK